MEPSCTKPIHRVKVNQDQRRQARQEGEIMASLIRDANGYKRIQFATDDGRPTIRLGKMPVKAAETMKRRIETLIACRTAGIALDAETACWLRDLPDDLHDRVARVGLAEPRQTRERAALGDMLQRYLDEVDMKPSTKTTRKQTRRRLVAYFGEDRHAASITEAEAWAWRKQQETDGLASATVARTVKIARSMFRWAHKQGLVKGNPFAEVRAGSESNATRTRFIDRATIDKVLEACPDAHWRALVSLSRFGGVRVPSEAFGLLWADIDWDRGRLFIRSPKTARHEGGEGRWIPLFPELRGPLMDLFELAEPGTERVLCAFAPGYNPRTGMMRIVHRAGLEAWPRLFHNLRASRQTELASEYPIHVVCEWLGNTRLVASKHYLSTTPADWERATGGANCGALEDEKAAHNAAQHVPAPSRMGSPTHPQPVGASEVRRDSAASCDAAQNQKVTPGGFEPPLPG
jgi:integrase